MTILNPLTLWKTRFFKHSMKDRRALYCFLWIIIKIFFSNWCIYETCTKKINTVTMMVIWNPLHFIYRHGLLDIRKRNKKYISILLSKVLVISPWHQFWIWPVLISAVKSLSDEFKRVTNTLSAKMRKYINDVPNIIIGIRRVSPGTCKSNIMSWDQCTKIHLCVNGKLRAKPVWFLYLVGPYYAGPYWR